MKARDRVGVDLTCLAYAYLLWKLVLMERIMRGKREIAEGRFSTQEEVEKLLRDLPSRPPFSGR